VSGGSGRPEVERTGRRDDVEVKEEGEAVLLVLLVTFAVAGMLFGEMMWWHIRITCDRLERRPPA
jgi:hypothetical protein